MFQYICYILFNKRKEEEDLIGIEEWVPIKAVAVLISSFFDLKNTIFRNEEDFKISEKNINKKK